MNPYQRSELKFVVNPKLMEKVLTYACRSKKEPQKEEPQQNILKAAFSPSPKSSSPNPPPPPPLPTANMMPPAPQPPPIVEMPAINESPIEGPPGSIRFCLLLDGEGGLLGQSMGMDKHMASVTSGIIELVWDIQRRAAMAVDAHKETLGEFRYAALTYKTGILSVTRVHGCLLCMFADREAESEFVKKRLLGLSRALDEPVKLMIAGL